MEMKKMVNKQIAFDVNKLLEQEAFQRFYFWLISEANSFSMPDIRMEGTQLSFREGQRSIGMGLIALCESYKSIDACRAAYEKMVVEVGQTINGNGVGADLHDYGN